MGMKTTKYDREAVVKAFYEQHPDAGDRADEWFDKWDYIMQIVKTWDEDCTDSEYQCLIDWFNGEEHLENWYRDQYDGTIISRKITL